MPRAFLALSLTVLAAVAGGCATGPREQRAMITAQQYGYDPAFIELVAERPARILLKAYDINEYSLSIPALNIEARTPRGRSTEIKFTPDQPGVYRFTNSETTCDACRGMQGLLVIKAASH